MSAYKRKDRNNEWWYQYRLTLPSGAKKRIKGKPAINTQKAAEDAERAHIERLLHPERVAVAEPEPTPSAPTVKKFLERFTAEYAPDGKPDAARTRNDHLKGSIVDFFGPLTVDVVARDQSLINRFKLHHKALAAQTIRNKLYALSALLNYAADCGLCPRHTLNLSVKGSKTAIKVEAVAETDVKKLLKHANDARYVAAILLASEAGLRIGEIRGAQWTDIKGNKLTVRRSVDTRNNLGPPKNGKARDVRLSPAIVRALKKLPRAGIWILTRLDDSDDGRKNQKRVSEPGGFLGYSGMAKALKKIYKRAGITIGEDIDPWHSLRHSFGTRLAADNVPPTVIQRLMDHSDIRTTLRYISTSADQMDAAIEQTFGR